MKMKGAIGVVGLCLVSFACAAGDIAVAFTAEGIPPVTAPLASTVSDMLYFTS